MSSTRMNDQIASGWRASRALLLATLLLMLTAASASAQGGGLGTTAGTAAVIIGDAVGIPGGTATVAITVEASEGEPGTATIDIAFDETILTAPQACEKDPRLTEHVVNTTMPSLCAGGDNDGSSCEVDDDCPGGACESRLRVQVLDLSTPLASASLRARRPGIPPWRAAAPRLRVRRATSSAGSGPRSIVTS